MCPASLPQAVTSDAGSPQHPPAVVLTNSPLYSSSEVDDDLPLASSEVLPDIPPPNDHWSSSPCTPQKLPALTVSLLRPRPSIGLPPPATTPQSYRKRSPSPQPSTPSKRPRQVAPIEPPPHTSATPSNTWHGNVLAPDSDEAFPELQLETTVDIEEEMWQPHIKHCQAALAGLGFTGPKSQKQLLAMILILHRRHNLIFILPTSFGKSMFYQFIAQLPCELKFGTHDVGGNTIVITPFAALLADQYNKSVHLGLRVFNWQSRGDSNHVRSDNRIIFIQPESFISYSFQR